MDNNQEQNKENIIKLDHKYQQLLQQLNEYENDIPLPLIESVLEQKGFYSDDEQVYKMIGCLTDKLMNDVVSSIVDLRFDQIKDKETKKRLKNRGVFTTHDIIGELQEQGLNPQEIFFPNMKITQQQQKQDQIMQQQEQKKLQQQQILQQQQQNKY